MTFAGEPLTPLTRESTWQIAIEFRSTTQQKLEYVLAHMTIKDALSAALDRWQEYDCPDPDVDGDIDAELFSIHVRPIRAVITRPSSD